MEPISKNPRLLRLATGGEPKGHVMIVPTEHIAAVMLSVAHCQIRLREHPSGGAFQQRHDPRDMFMGLLERLLVHYLFSLLFFPYRNMDDVFISYPKDRDHTEDEAPSAPSCHR